MNAFSEDFFSLSIQVGTFEHLDLTTDTVVTRCHQEFSGRCLFDISGTSLATLFSGESTSLLHQVTSELRENLQLLLFPRP